MAKIPTILTSEEELRFLEALKFPRGPAKLAYRNFRNYLAAMFMLHAGLRISEVLQLKFGMIMENQSPKRTLRISEAIAKGNKAREIPMSEPLRTEIQYLIDHFLIKIISLYTEYVFIGNDKTKPISPRRIQQVFKTASMNTIGRRVWPHVLRHTFATRLIRVTSTRIVQELLGHQSLASTQIYTHPNSQDLLKAIEKM